MAGLYDVWVDKKTGKEIHSYTIITTTPNELVGKYHERMPVILKKEDEAVWLNPDMTEPEQLLPLLKPYAAEDMEEWQVGDAARNPRNDYPELIKPVEEEVLYYLVDAVGFYYFQYSLKCFLRFLICLHHWVKLNKGV